MLNQNDQLLQRKILLINAENPRGSTVFKALEADPPSSEEEFRNLWKLYFISLVGLQLRNHKVALSISQQVISTLEETGLIPRTTGSFQLSNILSRIRAYINRNRVESVEGTTALDPATGTPTFSGKITFRDVVDLEGTNERVYIDELFRLANQALEEAGFQVWILLDRLDVAFAENLELEKNALRALFRVYLDLKSFEGISTKIFLRNDIWKRITEEGFREASHITSTVSIEWTKQTLLNLIIRRLLYNDAIITYYNVEREEVLSDVASQEKLFYRIFPDQVDLGEKRPKSLDWILTRTQDGTKENVPRELIHLLDAMRGEQLKRIEVGAEQPEGENLFERASMKSALPPVSDARYHQTLVAEYPGFKKYLEKLEGEKTNQTPQTLSTIWGVGEVEAMQIASSLSDVGFFEKRGTKEEPEFWVPFLYRDALKLVQGTAD